MIHPVDKFVGQKLREFRSTKAMTQSELADAVGIRFQQIQKYESGANRVSASRLWDISQVLDVHIGEFFEGMDGKPARSRRKFKVRHEQAAVSI